MTECIYINGDSWLAHFAGRVANSQHPLFRDKFVVNHAVPGSSNLEIIERTNKFFVKTLEKLNPPLLYDYLIENEKISDIKKVTENIIQNYISYLRKSRNEKQIKFIYEVSPYETFKFI